MAKKKPQKKRAGIEWVGGLVLMPTYVGGEGPPFRPESLLWINAEGAVLGCKMGKPGEQLGIASDDLRATIEREMSVAGHKPTRIRVDSPELAAVLRAGHAGIEVVCAPTPELEEVLEALCESLEREAARSFLSPEIEPDAMGAFFRATAALFRVQPWKIVPGDQDLISVTVEELGIHDAVISVVGQMEQSLGFVWFSSFEDFAAYLDAADDLEYGEEAEMPPHFALTFDRSERLGEPLLKEIRQHGWEVAGANAYPGLLVIDEELIVRPPTAEELNRFEAISLALAELFAEAKALVAAWNGGEPVERELTVRAHAGPLTVKLRAASARVARRDRPPLGVMAELLELERDGDEIPEEVRLELEEELVRLFDSSPEAQGLTDVQGCHFIMEYAANYCGVTIATLRAPALREVVFEIIPRKVCMEPSEARSLIEQARAFYAFLKRETGLKQADECLRVLAGDAVERLEAALADPRHFGMAKSLIMQGRDAGFDVNTKEGLNAWMQVAQEQPLPLAFPLPAPGQVRVSAASDKKKKKRKMARKARKMSQR